MFLPRSPLLRMSLILPSIVYLLFGVPFFFQTEHRAPTQLANGGIDYKFTSYEYQVTKLWALFSLAIGLLLLSSGLFISDRRALVVINSCMVVKFLLGSLTWRFASVDRHRAEVWDPSVLQLAWVAYAAFAGISLGSIIGERILDGYIAAAMRGQRPQKGRPGQKSE